MPVPYQNPSLTFEARVTDLLGRMTPAEKIGQINNRLKGWDCWQRRPDGVEPTGTFRAALQCPGLGAIYGIFRADPFAGVGLDTALGFAEGARLANALQREALAASRLGIPLLFAEEALHGLMAVGATTFPSPITLAGTWDADLVHRIGEAIALESRTQGVHLVYAPVCDLALDPRWSRCDECFGEDPALAARLSAALVEGLQGPAGGNSLAAPDRVGATLKHFAAHGASLGGFTSAPVSCGENELRRLHLRPFEAAVRAGAVSLMACHVAIDGIPCHVNHHLLTDILRDEWGFTGFVVSDGSGIDFLGVDSFGYGHECAESPLDAGVLALKAGVDSSLWDEAYVQLKTALDTGRITVADLDRACGRILHVKFQIGLFERPFVDETRRECLGVDPHRALAAEAAARSLTLLKNEGDLLPLKTPPRRIAVLGPNADQAHAQLGDYVACRPRTSVRTVCDGLRARFAESEIIHARGCGLREGTYAELAEAVAAARASDLAVIVVGGSSNRGEAVQNALGQSVVGEGEIDCGEGISKADLRLWPCQRRLVETVAATGTPVVVILIQGRPHALGEVSGQVPAILCAWSPGTEGGDAIAAVLAGDREPEGRLAIAIPREPGGLPVVHRRPLLARQRYIDLPAPALYPLGFGLGYTTWDFSAPSPAAPEFPREEAVFVNVAVSNTGPRDGATVVQAYVRIPGCLPVRPHRELVAWQRLQLAAGASAVVTLRIAVDELDLARDPRERIPIEIFTGPHSEDVRFCATTLVGTATH